MQRFCPRASLQSADVRSHRDLEYAALQTLATLDHSPRRIARAFVTDIRGIAACPPRVISWAARAPIEADARARILVKVVRAFTDIADARAAAHDLVGAALALAIGLVVVLPVSTGRAGAGVGAEAIAFADAGGGIPRAAVR